MCKFKCPECDSDHHTGCDMGETTLVYYSPIYKNGVNVNPDRNTTTRHITCLNCGEITKTKD